jgi:type III secretion system FlhB-like substrate exporter
VEFLKSWNLLRQEDFSGIVGIGLKDKSLQPVVSLDYQESQISEILLLAKKYDIPVVKNAALVDLLCNLDIDELLPDDLYWIVMVIISEIEKSLLVSRNLVDEQ